MAMQSFKLPMINNESQQGAQGKIITTKMPIEFQGMTIYLGGDDPFVESGPYRIEYILCNEFRIYSNTKLIPQREGFSEIRLKEFETKIRCYLKENESKTIEVILKYKTNDSTLERLVIEPPCKKLEESIEIANLCSSQIFDSICFSKKSPLQIRSIEIFQASTGKFVGKYANVDYLEVDLEEDSIFASFNMARELHPCLRLFREAINSTNPHYRLLCLYRIREYVDTLHKRNMEILKARGELDLRVEPVLVPDDPLSQRFIPQFINKDVTEFFNYVYTNYRIPIAHANPSLDDYQNLILDPAFSKTDHKVQLVNYIFIQIMPKWMEREQRFMLKHKLL